MATTKLKTGAPVPAAPDAELDPEHAGTPGEAGQTKEYARELGICLTCSHQPRCLFVRAARRPIMYCDEFDNQSASPALPDNGQPLPASHTLGQGPEPGLCVNCEERLGCNHRDPETTVHECEEYR
jgi:hypothetical protein